MWRRLLLLVGVTTLACGGSGDAATAAETPTEADPAAFGVAAPGDPDAAHYAFVVSEFTVDESFIAVGGANTCAGVREEIPAPDDPFCVRSDLDGLVEFDLAPGPGAITILKQVFTRALVPFVVDGDYSTEIDVPGMAVATAAAGQVGAPWPPQGTGLAMITVRDAEGNQLAGAQVSMGPEDGFGTAYTDAALGFPNLQLTETTRTGRVIFFELTPGPHQLTVTHPDLSCRPGESWPGSDGATADIPVEPETNTLASVICE